MLAISELLEAVREFLQEPAAQPVKVAGAAAQLGADLAGPGDEFLVVHG